MTRKLIAFAVALTAFAAAWGQPYWNNLEVYRLNKLQPHDRVVPEGPWRMSLNGTWAFRYYDTPGEATVTPDHWDRIRVPGNIELQGYGVPVYVNMSNEFPSDPPSAPTAYNPTGVYACNFMMPDTWRGRRTIVKFGAVKSAMYLYVNGQEVGYSEDSKTPAEWDITRYLHDGENRLAAKVVRWCNGSYLECQDMWRMSGITRDVELYSVPQTYITDVKITAGLDTSDWRTGRLDVMVDLNREVKGGTVEVRVEHDGKKVTARRKLENGDWFASLAPEVGSVEPWSDSTPVLYDITIRLLDARGHETERIAKRAGFRNVAIRGGLLCVNGKPVEIRGVNRHEHSMHGGHYITPDEMREDIRLMKEMGVNAVRTCHYPDDELWYDLCDSAGIYVWDEANVESHAQGYGEGSLAKKAEWLNPILDRIYNMYRRDRNHPSVIVWSLGNECGNGYCFEEAYRFLKGKDDTRPVAYERAELEWNTDIVSIMYPSVQYLSEYARNPQNKRPYIIAEYCHAMGNSMGGLQDYWDTIDKYPQLQGGFIWDWVDQAFLIENGKLKIEKPDAPTNSQSFWAAGGDLGELPGIKDDDAFCANGILAADRSPHPHAFEVEAVYTRGRGNVTVPQPGMDCDVPAANGTVRIVRDSRTVALQGEGFRVAVDRSDGSIVSYRFGNRELLARPLRWNFWRPPTENDRVDANGARAWQGLDRLQAEVLSVSSKANNHAGNTEVQIALRLVAPDGQRVRMRQIVEARADGCMQISCMVAPDGNFHTLPKVGLQMGIDTSFTGCSFYGNIHETYPDRRAAQRVGRWYKSLADLSAPQYVVPQEQGNREARWVRFTSGDSRLTVISPAEQDCLNFSVRRWNDSLLTAARRWRNMVADSFYTVSLDYRQAGLGTATCGPGVADRHTVSGDSTYTFRFIFDPLHVCAGAPYEGFAPHPDISRLPPSDGERILHVASVVCQSKPADKYSQGFPMSMADSRRGVPGDYTRAWAGFHGVDTVEMQLTLKPSAAIGSIAVGACHSPSDWVVKPLDVQASWSTDGHRWSRWESMDMSQPPTDIYTSSCRLVYTLMPQKTHRVRYVRLRFICRPELPVWHPYAGEPAWLMVDEVEIGRAE